jgi:TM2 domain-containing membrane protein YozV
VLTFLSAYAIPSGFAQDSTNSTVGIRFLTDSAKILAFANHLYVQQDFLRASDEYERYLFYFPHSSNADTMQYRIALCHQQRTAFSAAINAWNKMMALYPRSALNRRAQLQIGYTCMLASDYISTTQYLSEHLSPHDDTYNEGQMLIGWSLLKQKQWNSVEDFAKQWESGSDDTTYHEEVKTLRQFAANSQTIPRRSPFAAAAFSAVVPGLGKIYTGQYGDGITAFVLTGIFGFLTYDSYRTDHDVRAGIFAGITLFFYGGNIYGSYIAAQVYNRERESEYLRLIDEQFHRRAWKVELHIGF